MNRYYEMMCIIRPNLLETEADQVVENYHSIITKHNGTEIERDYLGKKLLVYPVIKIRQEISLKNNYRKSGKKIAGIYIKIKFKVDSREINELIGQIQSNQETVRCLIIKLKDDDDKDKNDTIYQQKYIDDIEDNDGDNELEDDEQDEPEEEQKPVLSSEERAKIIQDNVNNLNNKVNLTTELSKLRSLADSFAWGQVTEWIAESVCDINFSAASKSAKRLMTKVRHKTPYEIAHQLIIHKSLQVAGLELIGDVVETVNNILDGLAGITIDIPTIAKLSAEMVYQIAEIYGFDIDAPQRKEEALYIFGLTLLAEKVIGIGIDWLKRGTIATKLLKVGSKALMIYGIGHLACLYYEYKSQYKFDLIPPDNLINQLGQQRDNYFPDDLSDETVRQKLTREISTAFPDVNYQLLNSLLAEGKWKEADTETGYIIADLLNRGIKDNTKTIPGKDVYIIDYLWCHYSKGKFGFQVQKDVFYQSKINKNIRKFGKILVWRGMVFWKGYDQLIFDLDQSPKAHLPAFWFDKYESYFRFKGNIVKDLLKPILERNDWINLQNVTLSEDGKLIVGGNDVDHNNQ